MCNKKTILPNHCYSRPLTIISRSFFALSYSPLSNKERIIISKVLASGMQPLAFIFDTMANAPSNKPFLQNPLIIVLYVYTSTSSKTFCASFSLPLLHNPLIRILYVHTLGCILWSVLLTIQLPCQHDSFYIKHPIKNCK